jgi:serine/threonine protein kinase
MVYILELETSQTNAIRILIDTISSIVTDVKFTFCPYYIDKSSKETENSETETELVTENNDNKVKQVGGLIIKEINKVLCVIKTIYIDTMDEKMKKEALIEATILQRLDHPNIIKFKETFTMKKPKLSLCIVMEYCDGKYNNLRMKNNHFFRRRLKIKDQCSKRNLI